jgi:uncharacterized membrane protein
MWTRADLKQSAKDVLRKNYWMAFLVSLVYSILAGGVSSGSSSANSSVSRQITSSSSGVDLNVALAILGVMLTISAIAFIVGIAVSFFVTGPMNVGKNRYYMESRVKDSSFGQLFYGFKANYMGNASSMFVTNLFIGLWSLLLVVPGIIKGLEWSQVAYLLAENPNLTGQRARQISSAMTEGEKWDIFVLQLSFIGWNLLGALACGIGVFFVNPYVEATYAELYARLRDKALTNGFATIDELPGIDPFIS